MFGDFQVAGMSVGEAQLISLARVLMRKDEVAVVVMDEASSPFLCKPAIFASQPLSHIFGLACVMSLAFYHLIRS